jgi:hypothetical protein
MLKDHKDFPDRWKIHYRDRHLDEDLTDESSTMEGAIAAFMLLKRNRNYERMYVLGRCVHDVGPVKQIRWVVSLEAMRQALKYHEKWVYEPSMDGAYHGEKPFIVYGDEAYVYRSIGGE